MSSDKIPDDPNLITLLDLQRNIYRDANFFIQSVKENVPKDGKVPKKETLQAFAMALGKLYLTPLIKKQEQPKKEPELIQKPGELIIHPKY